ncbi:YolD-like family protein [Bacillus sp. FJAT-49732]|uniref:YolD-like family protein n=1 Tax=Lederbergia citrisecunda TaxID=2833583 RepID=A0A942TR01_9BACI|nr:YolD-like family protein [Lederbergia citrisecunda]MBS4200264.1 YolD-like family protein [Lederbergia citrisecunda]
MDIKDRGMKKWHGFMMPEHIGHLHEMWEEYEKEKKPILDEYQLREIDEKLAAANEFNLPVIFELWINGFFEDAEGRVHNIDSLNKTVWITEWNGDLKKIKMDDVVGVEFKD